MKIDLPDKFHIFLDFDVEKLKKVIEAVATSLGLIVVTVAVILIGDFASICLAVIIATLLLAAPAPEAALPEAAAAEEPMHYKPPCFTHCTEEVNNPWTKNPLKMEVSNFNSKDLVFDLEVKSVLGPSQDNSDVNQVVTTEPAASRGFIHVTEIARTNGNGRIKGGSASQSKRPRKASVVEEPILQKAQVA